MNVLELGCGIGVTLLRIKYLYPNAALFGWEPDVHKADISGYFASVSHNALNHMSEFEDGFFDYILIGHYPEWVENPKLLMKNVAKKLKAGGFVIATIKNIMYYNIIRDMLTGKWFSSEHIQNKAPANCFTQKDFTALLNECGFINHLNFHWFSVPNEEDKVFIQKICDIRGEKKDFDLTTYLYSIRAQKNG